MPVVPAVSAISLAVVFLVSASLIGTAAKRVWQLLKQRKARSDLPPIEPLHTFDWREEKPRQLRPFKPVYNMSMGIQNEALSNLITVDSQYLDRTTIRRHIISDYKDTVHGYLPGGETAVSELYSYILTHHLPTRFPPLFKVESGEFKNLVTGRTFPAEPPKDPQACLQILAETIEEDIFLLKETDTTHVCLAFACCFPTGFDPSSKLGADLAGIHTPVPHYDKIGPSMERYFRKIKPGQVIRRMNWNVQTSDDLINLAGNHIKEGDFFMENEDINHSQTNLRVELQSLTRLPETKFLLFCFKTFLYPFEDLKRDGSGTDLADAIEGLQKGNAPEMHKYKSAIRWGKSAVEYLRSQGIQR